MTPAALLARLTSRGYIPVSHGATGYPENWLDLDGPAGSIRVVTHPGDGERVEVYGLGPGPAGLVFEVHMSGGTPEALTVAMLNAAEAWLSGRLMTPAIQRAADGLPPGGSRPRQGRTCHERARQPARRAQRIRAPGHHRPRHRRQQAPVPQCATCILRAGDTMHLGPERLRAIISQALAAGSFVVCHDTLTYGDYPDYGPAAVKTERSRRDDKRGCNLRRLLNSTVCCSAVLAR